MVRKPPARRNAPSARQPRRAAPQGRAERAKVVRGALPARTIAELKAIDLAHHMPPLTNYADYEKAGGVRVVASARGSIVRLADGHELIDGMAGLWCVNVGYGRDAIARAADRQMRTLPFYNAFFRTAAEPTIRLTDVLAPLLGERLDRFFFCNSGSEAADTALRLIRHYWTVRGEPERFHVISRMNAYHGSTVAGASLGGNALFHSQGGLPIPGIHHVAPPWWSRDGRVSSPEAFGRACADALEKKILELGAAKIAAFIAEPIQGAGGVIVPPDSYWPAVSAVLERHGIPLIVDEVICGFGRLGRWFGHQKYGLKPDLVMMAKGVTSGYLPLAAVAVSREIFGTIRNTTFAHGYTYTGHPVAAAAALANLAIMKKERLVERVERTIGPRFQKMIASFAGHPLIGDTRAVGLLGALELDPARCAAKPPAGTLAAAVRDACFADGVIVRAIGDVVALCPPLVITPAELARIGAALGRALDTVAATYPRQ